MWRVAVALVGVIALVAVPSHLHAQSARLTGFVRDSATGAPLESVRVEVLRGARVVARVITDGEGLFTIADLVAGEYELAFTRIDYRRHVIANVTVAAGETLRLQPTTLVAVALVLNPIVVSVSRRTEKVLDAPAAVTVIERQTIEERPALTAADHVVGQPGIDVAQTGLTQHEIVSRGFNNAASGQLLVLTDNRYASVPSLRINLYNFIPATNDDVERIELVRGPGAALYGPNSAQGVMHVITRSPFESEGTVVSVGGGERSLFTASARHASTLGRKFGFKVSAQYLRGNDWPFVDPDETSPRDPVVERASGELRVDWRPGRLTTVKFNAGLNHAFRNVEITAIGAAQARDWQYRFAQAQVTTGRLFAQAFINQSSAGETFLLRTGQPIADNSRMFVAQVQHGALLYPVDLTYGVDVQRTEPRTGGTITGRNEADDVVDEIGAYFHTETRLAERVDVVAAARIDYHNRLRTPVFSPRVAAVFRAADNHTIRATYNRAFATPSTNDLFLDLIVDSVSADILGRNLPFAIRVAAVPSTGFSFKRDCAGGLCMRSPFTPDALGGPSSYVPLDATLLWFPLLDSLAAWGVDLTGLPAPTSAQVSTNMGLFDGLTGERTLITDVSDLPRLRSVTTNTFELGYRGIIARRLLIGLDLWRTTKNNFIGPLRLETPNAFLDSASLGTYLGSFMSVDSAAVLAGLASQLPVGTVSPIEARDPWDLIITNRNFGDITLWGADVEVGMFVTRTLNVAATYSWTSDDVFPNVDGITDIALNAPASKGSLRVEYHDDLLGLSAELRGRYVRGFPVNSGVYVGTVDEYGLVDARVGYRLPWIRGMTVTVAALNVLNYLHAEFVGTPSIGRLVTARLRAEF